MNQASALKLKIHMDTTALKSTLIKLRKERQREQGCINSGYMPLSIQSHNTINILSLRLKELNSTINRDKRELKYIEAENETKKS